MKAAKRHLVLVRTRWRVRIREDALGEGMLEQIKSKGGILRRRQRDVQRLGGEQQETGEDNSPFGGRNRGSEAEVTLVQGHIARSCRQLNPL